MCAIVYSWRHLVKATEVTALQACSGNVTQPPGGWLKVTCALTAHMYTGISSGPNAR